MCAICLDTALLATRRARAKDPNAFRRSYQEKKALGLCVGCGVEGKPMVYGLLCYGCGLVDRQRNVRLKNDAIQKYGGECECCGETRIAFLTIDHKNNDGAERRREDKHYNGRSFYRRLVREPIDPTLRVLCWNCNLGRRSTGVCPHKDNSFYDIALARGHYQRRTNLLVSKTQAPIDTGGELEPSGAGRTRHQESGTDETPHEGETSS